MCVQPLQVVHKEFDIKVTVIINLKQAKFCKSVSEYKSQTHIVRNFECKTL